MSRLIECVVVTALGMLVYHAAAFYAGQDAGTWAVIGWCVGLLVGTISTCLLWTREVGGK